ncbi:MAG: glycoside hydrolase family 18 protein [Janthinobacterium lividum]
MKSICLELFLTTILALSSLLPVTASPVALKQIHWTTAYYPVSTQKGDLTPDKIDYSAITHLIHFSITPRPDGTIADSITPAQSADVISHAHKGGDKVLICLGGAGSGPAISPVIADPMRGVFIKNLITFVSTRGYDGLDVDMEPIAPSDEGNFIKFIKELRAAMKATNPKWLLTIPASGEPGDQPKLCALLQNDFDQINIQTYDLSGKWDGFKTWYNGSLYGEGKTLMTDTRPYPSVDEKVNLYLAAGVPKAKLGIGIAFYGYVWTGANGPAQAIQGVKLDTLGYNAIMDQYFQPGVSHWDALAHAPYLSIGTAQDSSRKFISYDDARLTREKVLYARTHGLGGVIIWELGDGYRADQPAGRKDVLLQVIKEASHEPLVSKR